MNNTRKILLKVQFLSFAAYIKKILGGSTSKRGKGAAGLKMLLIAALAVYVAVCFAGLFYLFFSQLGEPFHRMGIDWLYFAMAFMAALVLMFVGSIFVAQAQLFEAKDNELLLSMPVEPGHILFCRIIVLYLYSFVLELPVLLPAGYVYLKLDGVTALGAAAFVIILICLPLLSLTLTILTGWVITALSAKVRRRSLFTMLLYLVFLGLYYYGYSKMNVYIQKLIMSGDVIAGRIRGSAQPLYYFGNGVARGDVWQLAVTVFCLIVPFAAVYFLLSKCFIRIVTAKRGFSGAVYRERRMRAGSVRRALYHKEWRRFTASPVYMLNGSFGAILLVAAGLAAIVKGKELMLYLAAVPKSAESPAVMIALLICVVSSTGIVAAASISLEGRNLWILRSMPVPVKAVLMAKVKLQLSMYIPAALFAGSVCAAVVVESLAERLILILLPAAANVLFALLGVAVNLKFPKLDWNSEISAVKQSAGSIIGMLSSMALIFLPMVLYLRVLYGRMPEELFGAGLTVLYALMSMGFYRYLCTGGCRRFEEL